MSEISEDMIHKAAVVISELRESENGLVLSSHIAKAALEAAGVTEMAARIASAEQIIASRQAELNQARARIVALEAELAQYQTSKFHPDWSLLQTANENLRDAWARIRELEAELMRVREVLHEQTSYLEGRLRNAMTGEGCPHGCVRPSQCVDCIKERG